MPIPILIEALTVHHVKPIPKLMSTTILTGLSCLLVALSALSLALKALNGTPQSEVTPHESCFLMRAGGSIEL
ncbi:hypothetical protein J6590_026559 [Homalodisca vitripennis]|nr:hypothetical protein J6590_026559 [Homalodisca vitripennis]